ncbi:MAG: protein-tyrosine sulfotransferase [Bacteroidia bacterium]|jgi:protein-tyrosine sulfotransferase
MNSPVIIVGCTKSGTTLIRSLFDGHPELFAIPFESHFFQNTGRWVEYSYRRTMPSSLSFEEKKRKLLEWITHSNENENAIADGFTVGKFDVKLASNYLMNAQVHDERSLSDAYTKAIYLASFGKEMPTNLEFVEKSVENAEMSSVWQDLYPEARFVHILRNPYSNLVAMRKYGAHYRNGNFPRLQNALQAMCNSYYWLYRNQRQQKNYQVLIYDDLISDVAGNMRKVADKLGLKYDDILTKPTIGGEQWKGNSTSGKSYSGVSAKNVTAWKDEITPLEIELVNKYFGHVLDDFGFERMEAKKSVYWPNKNERPEIWVYNRLLKYFV